MNCGDAVHSSGFGCCYLWCKRDTSTVKHTLDEQMDRGKELADSMTTVICLICASCDLPDDASETPDIESLILGTSGTKLC